MKVVHICSMDFAGAGKAAYRLHSGLRELGVASSMIVMCRKTIDDAVHELPSDVAGSPDRWWGLLSGLWQRQLVKYPDRRQDSELFSDFAAVVPLASLSDEIRSADVVHLHWVAGLLDDRVMPEFLHGKKIVWTLHDMNPFTGGCHYAGECTRYEKNCGCCPQLASGDPEDISFGGWSRKRHAYLNLDITVVSPSTWLGACSGSSSLLGRFQQRIIPNGFPLDIFRPLDRSAIRTALAIPSDTRVVLFCADSTATKRKGFAYLLDALQLLSERGCDARLTLAVVGSHAGSDRPVGGFPVMVFGHIAAEEQMAALYNAADVFVLPSLEDNLPNTVVESLACGTPVAAFDVGGIPDMVEHGVNGYLAPVKDVAALADAIEWCVDPGRSGMRKLCLEKAEAVFRLDTQAQAYLQLYESLTSATRRPAPVKSVKAAPRITIVTPSYNQAEYLEECIDSILSQNYPNLEYIIMDGGSSDGSLEIIKKYQRHLAHWQSQPDGGQYRALNQGFRRSSGEIMTWLNSDDRLERRTLAQVASIFSGLDTVDWVTGRPRIIDAGGSQLWLADTLPIWSREKYLNMNYYNPYIQQEGTFWRRNLWNRAGAHIAGYLELAADLELWSRFFRYTRLFSVDAVLASYRQHADQKMASLLTQYNHEAEQVLRREIARAVARPDSETLAAPLPILFDGDGNPYV